MNGIRLNPVHRLHEHQLGARSIRIAAVLLALILAAVPAAADDYAGTFSIVAFDSTSGEAGVAVQSRVFGVGPRVAWVKGGAGAIATQANSNETFGPRGLELLQAGLGAKETLAWLIEGDDGRDSRQVGIVDANGGVANWTGSGCSSWAGDSAGVAFSCQGNILTGADVVAEMARAFLATDGQELARRLLAALVAGQAAGGDSRGRQSACILVGRPHIDFPEYSERYVDIRIDDHPAPIEELGRLYDMYEAQGLVQAHMRFADHMDREGDAAGAKRERERVGQVLKRILTAGNASAGTLNSLAWFTATNDIYLDGALAAAKQAAALEPENTNILDTLAESYFRNGNFTQAIEIAERAVEMAPDDVYLKEQLARFKAAR